RARAERVDRQVAAGFGRLNDVLRILAGAEIGAGGHRSAPALRGVYAGARVGDVVRGLVDEMLKIVAALRAEEAAAVGIGVDVDEGLAIELVGVGFGPLGRAQEPRLFAVPARVDDRPRRAPTLAVQCPERLNLD